MSMVNHDTERKEQQYAGRAMAAGEQRDTLRPRPGFATKRTSPSVSTKTLKGHDAVLKKLQADGTQVTMNVTIESNDGYQRTLTGYIVQSDKFTITLRHKNINSVTVDMFIYKHAILCFYATPQGV